MYSQLQCAHKTQITQPHLSCAQLGLDCLFPTQSYKNGTDVDKLHGELSNLLIH